jgi:hypothetical protein
MPIVGILSQDQASDINLATSIQQWLMTQVKVAYDTAASAASLNAGVNLQGDGTWKANAIGLYIANGTPDDLAIYEQVPVVAYNLDASPPKSPVPTGMGDGAQYEYRSVKLCCLPAVTVGSDGTIQPNNSAQWILKSFINNAILRANIMPIVDHSASKVGGFYPQIGYAEIRDQKINSMDKIAELLGTNKFRFDVSFTLCYGVSTTN